MQKRATSTNARPRFACVFLAGWPPLATKPWGASANRRGTDHGLMRTMRLAGSGSMASLKYVEPGGLEKLGGF